MTDQPKNVIISTRRSSARRDQLVACVVGAALLGGAMLYQPTLQNRRQALVIDNDASLKNLIVAFPRLTLGGFRGLLSTILWMQAEEDKNERRWVELETKYDLIGTLQPYFTTVYIFHAWNQAYNLSAQWHSVDAKYKWVLDGLSYLYKGEEYNPSNPDLQLEIGHLYFLKISGSFERIFFRAHWRADIARMYELDEGLKQSDATDALKHVYNFVLRPQFKAEKLPATDGSNRSGFGIQITDPDLFTYRTDGKKVGEPVPFRYGLSPYYFAHQEYKRTLASGNPTTTGIAVVDAWPAMSLRLWCRDDLYYTATGLNEMFNPNAEPAVGGEKSTLTTEDFNRRVLEYRDCYRNVEMIAPKSVDLFEQHLLKFPNNRSIHNKHIAETRSYRQLARAESKMFEALVKWHYNERKMTPAIRNDLLAAIRGYEEAIPVMEAWINTVFPTAQERAMNPDREEYDSYTNALRARITGLQALTQLGPTDQPNFSFLSQIPVER